MRFFDFVCGLHGEWILGVVILFLVDYLHIYFLLGFEDFRCTGKKKDLSFIILLVLYMIIFCGRFLRSHFQFVVIFVGSWCLIFHYCSDVLCNSIIFIYSYTFAIIKGRFLLSTVLKVYSTDTKELFFTCRFFQTSMVK